MKIVAWVCNQPNQTALLHKINERFPLSGIVIENPVIKRKWNFKLIFNAIVERIFLKRGIAIWWGMLDYYKKKYPSFPDVKRLDVENINSDEAYNFTNELKPDIIIVSGTRLVRKKMLSIMPTIGILNLHTGLSPYIKGGPNCTNWCIATKQFHFIGNTIMWINAGIDTGNIITTEQTNFTGNETLQDVHIKVMEHGHDLYVNSIAHLAEGHRNNVTQQSIAEGTTYYNREWNLKQKFRLLKNFKEFKKTISQPAFLDKKKTAKVVPL